MSIYHCRRASDHHTSSTLICTRLFVVKEIFFWKWSKTIWVSILVCLRTAKSLQNRLGPHTNRNAIKKYSNTKRISTCAVFRRAMGERNGHMASQKGVSFASSELLTPVRIISPTPNNQWHVNWGGCNSGSNDRKLCAVAMCKHPCTITDGLSKEMRIIRSETKHK